MKAKRNRFVIFILLSTVYSYSYGQTIHYLSPKYNYSIDIPISFKKDQPRSINNDLIFIEPPGNSINMIVVKRDFKTNSPYDLSKDFFYSIFVKTDPNVKIFDDSKIIVNGIKVFKYVKTMQSEGMQNKLNYVCFIYYNGDMQFILTMTCETSRYIKYKAIYDVVGKSVKFK